MIRPLPTQRRRLAGQPAPEAVPRPPLLPSAGIAGLVAFGAACEAFLAYRGGEPSPSSSYLWAACFSFCVAWWIEADRKARAVSAPFEYPALVFFLWPVAAPCYLFRTRRWRGLLQGIGLVALSCLPGVAALLAGLLAAAP